METFMCSTDPDPANRPAPQRLSSVFMTGGWTYHAYSISHDGETIVINQEDGLEVQRKGRAPVRFKLRLPYTPRDLMWSPDNKHVAFWAPPEPGNPGGRRVAILDVTRITKPEEPPLDVVYDPDASRSPFGLEWSPSGESVFVVENMQDPTTMERFSTIMRIDLSNRAHPKEIVRMSGTIDFFMPPTSRYEHGEGPSAKDYRIVFGHTDGLFVTDPDGKRCVRVSQIPATGLYNVEWSPDPTKEIVALFFRRASPTPDGRTFQGVWLVDLRRPIGAPDNEGVEQLYDGIDVHTLWFSPKGTYVTWATPSALCYRKVTDTPDKTVRLTVAPAEDGTELDIKGATWKNDEKRLAFTAGNKLFLHEVGAKTPPLELASFGNSVDDFSAEPRFLGDMVFLSVFNNAGARMQKKLDTMLGGVGSPSGQPTTGELVHPNPVTPLGAPVAPPAPAPGTAPAAPPATNPPRRPPPRRP